MSRYLTVVLLALLSAASIQAETYVLSSDGTGDYPTIQAAIDAAEDGDIIELLDGNYTGTGNRDIAFAGRGVIIRSQSGASQACVIDCQGSSAEPHRGFIFATGEQSDSFLENLTITNGWEIEQGGGAILCDGASPTITGCVFSGNTTTSRGGALICMDSSPLVANCVFRGNTADVSGGMHCSNPSTPVVIGCWFEDNTADVAGGFGCSSTCTPDVERCVFLGNIANGYGGAMYCDNAAPTVTNCTFVANTAGYFAGCIGGSFPDPPPRIINSIVAFGGNGQPIWCELGPPPEISCSNVFGNEDGDWVSCISGQAGLNGNLSVDPLFCDRTGGDLTLHSDSECLPDNNDCDVLIGALLQGCPTIGVVDNLPARQKILVRAYPNPFNPRTTLSFTLPGAGHAAVAIYDAWGMEVARLVEEALPAGAHTVDWTGVDAFGRSLPSGTYFCRLTTSWGVETRKMSLLR